MGMDPISQNEVHEVTIQVSGEVTVKAFNEFQKKLREFIADASGIFATEPVQDPEKKLQLRVVRQAVRLTIQ
jgi:hypothetical protein